jgi:hypothetical protein
LKLHYDELLSNFAFKFNLRCYNKGMTNPDGLHIVKLDTGVQIPTPPVQAGR